MHASEEDRLEEHFEPENEPSKPKPLLVGAIVVALIAALITFFLLKPEPEITVTEVSPTEEDTIVEQEPTPPPEIPLREAAVEPEFTLPTLDLSDTDFRGKLINLSTEMAPWLQTDELVRRGVSFTDGMTKGELLTKLVSIPPPSGKFLTKKQGEAIFLSPKNYDRYDYLVKIIDSVNPEALTDLFDLYRPLLEEAYGELGYKPENLGGQVIKALDQILAAPVINTPVELLHDSVYYTFAEQSYEDLSTLQKQLIRMGPEATKIIQQKANLFKVHLLKEPELMSPEKPAGEAE